MERPNNFSPDQKRALEQIIEHGYRATSEKLRTLPQISALSATLLVVATFNKELIQVTSGVRFTLIVLLFLIPISLFIHILELSYAESKAKDLLKNFLGEEVVNDAFSKNLGWKFVAYSPYILTFIVFMVVTYLSYLICF